jgi:DNA-directed RNA polymerase III subunit RPC8
MFLLAVIEDTLKTLPDQFERDSGEVLLEQIDLKFANKVLVDVGLCITLFDFIDVGDPFIYPAEGSAHQRVKFRMVVFRPFAGEVT